MQLKLTCREHEWNLNRGPPHQECHDVNTVDYNAMGHIITSCNAAVHNAVVHNAAEEDAADLSTAELSKTTSPQASTPQTLTSTATTSCTSTPEGDDVADDKNDQPLRWHWSEASLPLASTTLWPMAPRLWALFLFWQAWQASYRAGPPGRFPPFHRSACRHTGRSRSPHTHGGVVQMSSPPQAIETLRRSIPVGSTSAPKNDTCTLHKPWFIPSSCPVSYPWRLRGPWLIGSWPLSWMWGPEICGWFLSMCHPQLLWLIPLYSCNSGMNCDNTWCICTSIMARLAGRSASMPPRSWASNSSWTRCSTRWTYCTLHNK